jgi:hypothetical protein
VKLLKIAGEEARVLNDESKGTKIDGLEYQISYLNTLLKNEKDDMQKQQDQGTKHHEKQLREQQELDKQHKDRERDVIRMNDVLEMNKTSLYNSFHIPTSTSKATIEYEPKTMKLTRIRERGRVLVTSGLFTEKKYSFSIRKHDVKAFLHPYLDMQQLFTYVWNKTPEGRSLDLLIEHCRDRSCVHIKLNEKISSTGANDIGIQPFVISCNNVFNIFSAVEVNFGNGNISVVLVGAIVSLERVAAPALSRRTVLVGFLLKKDVTRNKWGCPVLQYDICSSGPHKGALEVVVFDLTSIVRPACLIPEFTKAFPVGFRPTYQHQILKTGSAPSLRRFYHVSIPYMHYIKVVDWIEIQQARMNRNEDTKAPAVLNKNYVATELYLTREQLERTEAANKSLGDFREDDENEEVESANESNTLNRLLASFEVEDDEEYEIEDGF